jgi:hypothetical protein
MSRRKCSGETPCSACKRRSLKCEYPAVGNSRRGSLGSTSTLEGSSNGSSALQVITSPCEFIMSSWSNTLQPPAATSQGPTSTVVEHTLSRQDRAENIYNGQPTHNDPLFYRLTSPGQPQLRMEESQSAINISSLISENQSIFNSYNPPLFGRSNLQNATGTQYSSVENEYHEDSQGTGLWYQGSLSAIDWLQDAWTPDFSMEDRDEGLVSFDQRSSHLLGNAPGICEPGRGIERTKCNEKRPHCGQCDGRKLNCVYGTAQPPTSRSQSSMLMQHDGYGQYCDDDCSTQYGLVPGHI